MSLPLLDRLKEVLAKDERFISEGEILKNKIVELAIKLDKDLIRLLLSDVQMKEVFFVEMSGVMVFDKDKFIKFVSNKEFLPDSYTAFKNKIGLIEDDEFIKEKKEVVLSWPYKDCVLQGGMTKEDQKRDEIFWNQTLAPDEISRLLDPKVFTNAKRIDAKGEHPLASLRAKRSNPVFKTDENGDIKDNLIIKGNNLLALHSLKKRFARRVKLIYIDPPYGRDADTFYNDSFKRSSWLTFMKNRLDVARDLLTDDGAIFVQISDVNEGVLRLLMDEVFQKENFVNKITIRTKSPSGFQSVNPGVFEVAEYLLVYEKEKGRWEYNPQYVASNYDSNYSNYVTNRSEEPKSWNIVDLFEYVAQENGFKNKRDAVKKLGVHPFNAIVADFAKENAERIFRFTEIGDDAAQETVQVREGSRKQPKKIFHIKREGNYDIYVLNGREISFYSKKIREIDGVKVPSIQLTNIWNDISWEGIASEGGVKLKKGKKPERLLRRIIAMGSNKEDIVLDFFLGSGSTAAVAHKMSRQYVGIEQLEYEENDSIVRLQNVMKGEQSGVSRLENWKGGGDFVYMELAKWNEDFVEQIKKAKTTKELQALWQTLKGKACLSYKVDSVKIDASAKDFAGLSLEDQKRFLLETLDQNHLYINYSEIDDKEYGVSNEDIKLNEEFYG